MATDTITIPPEIPREIRDGDKVLRVVGFEYGPLKVSEWYWDQGSQRFLRSHNNLPTSIYLKPITEPVSRYIYPTPVEALDLLKASNFKLKCEFSDDGMKWVRGECNGIVGRGNPFWSADGVWWYEKIRVLQSE